MKRRDVLRAGLAASALWPVRQLFANGGFSKLPEVAVRTLSGTVTSIRGSDVRDLAAGMRGDVLLSDQPGYDQARRVWNGIFDKRPALIARCAAASDVQRIVTFARDHHLLTAVRAGGHSISGKSTCDGGLVIDVTSMHDVRVDATKRIAHVEGGALLQHLDRQAQSFNLVTTAGTVSHTGAAGLTLGGGLGRVGRHFGLACDNLRSVDIVTADGKLLTASYAQNADLFWGLRGGGGNFGVATAFEYALHPMDTTILGGAIAWPIEQAREVLRFYADFSRQAPDELNLDVALVTTPDGALILLEACWSADLARGEDVLKPVRSFGQPVFDKIAPMKYLDLQSGSDGRLPHGIRFYGKSGFVTELTNEGIDKIVDTFTSAPLGSFSIVLQQSGGAIGRTPTSATAFPNRGANYWLMVSKSWTEPSEDEPRIERMRDAWKSLAPLMNGFYVNAMGDDDAARLAANYGENYPRLQQLKRKFDPTNQFRLNANIAPA